MTSHVPYHRDKFPLGSRVQSRSNKSYGVVCEPPADRYQQQTDVVWARWERNNRVLYSDISWITLVSHPLSNESILKDYSID